MLLLFGFDVGKHRCLVLEDYEKAQITCINDVQIALSLRDGILLMFINKTSLDVEVSSIM